MDDEISSHYIFLFMLLLIPFLVLGLSIKANIIQFKEQQLWLPTRHNQSTFVENFACVPEHIP